MQFGKINVFVRITGGAVVTLNNLIGFPFIGIN